MHLNAIDFTGLLPLPVKAAFSVKSLWDGLTVNNPSSKASNFSMGTTVQNTGDFNPSFDVSNLTAGGLAAMAKAGLNAVETTSSVIPDFLRNATSLNTTISKPSPGALALAQQQLPWYQDKTKLMIAGGVALSLAALFVFTGNKKR